MPSRPPHLPEYELPPVVETALSVQFDPIPALRTAHLGLLWSKFRDEFPQSEEHSALEPVVEHFPAIQPPSARLLRLQELDRPPVPRLWFLSAMGDEMVQVQNGRFVRNWRKTPGQQYPRYDDALRPKFNEDFVRFQGFLRDCGLGEPVVNQCEIVYVNHILAGEIWTDFQEIGKVFRCCADTAFADFETTQLSFHSALLHDGKPIGRLHVDIQPAFRVEDGAKMFFFQLTARGIGPDSLGFLDLGREAIVLAFDSMTTPEMHKIWRKKIYGGSC